MTRYSSKHGQYLQNTLNAIYAREDFDAGNLWANKLYFPRRAELPAVWWEDLKEMLDCIEYVVYSYATPIAWYVEGEGWVVPEVRYSNSSTSHQSTVRKALLGVETRITTLASIRRAEEIFASA